MDACRECSQTFQVWAEEDSSATPFPGRSIEAANGQSQSPQSWKLWLRFGRLMLVCSNANKRYHLCYRVLVSGESPHLTTDLCVSRMKTSLHQCFAKP
jgi:hypothetical protein